MKELLIFRIFTLFPLVGITIPDIANKLSSSSTHISTEHIIVEVTLAICVIICSARIWIAENRHLRPTTGTDLF